MSIDRRLEQIMSISPGVVAIPAKFVINGTSTPDGLTKEVFSAAARSAAGKFILTLRDSAYEVVAASANANIGDDSTDIYAQVDAASATGATPTITVRTKTGATNTDPPDNTVISVILFVKITARAAGGT